jgi:hypothetical protein
MSIVHTGPNFQWNYDVTNQESAGESRPTPGCTFSEVPFSLKKKIRGNGIIHYGELMAKYSNLKLTYRDENFPKNSQSRQMRVRRFSDALLVSH